MAARILLTGHRGFTGRYVATELECAGFDVHGLAEGDTPVDLLDREAVGRIVEATRPEVVVHLAAIAFVAHDDVDAIYRTNVVGTRNLLASLADRDDVPRHVIVASSANVYGNAQGCMAEDTPADPRNDYAVSKLAMEYMARTWMSRLPITVVRPFNYTGAGQSTRFLIPKIVDHYRRGASTIELGNVDIWRDFSDVRDIALAYTRLATGAPHDVLNFCSGREVSLREVLAMMEAISGRTIDVTVRQDLVRANEIRQLRGDATRMDAALGITQRIPLESTLRWMFEA